MSKIDMDSRRRAQVHNMSEFLNNISQAQKNLEKVLVEMVPDNYLKPASHLNTAQKEVLKAIKCLIDNRINDLEDIGKEIEKKSKRDIVKMEKVEVE